MGLADYLPKKEEKRDEPVVVIPQEPKAVNLNNEPELADIPALAYKAGRDEPMKVVSVPVAPVKEREKPEGMSEEDYEAALSVFSPERVSELYTGFDPAAVEPFYAQLYKTISRKPEEPDEKRVQSARTLAGIGDALGLIAQTVAASQDGLIDLRNPAESAAVRTGLKIDKLKDVYKRDRDVYDSGLLGNQLKDVEGARGAFMKDRAALLAYLAKLKKDKLDAANRDKRFQGEMVYKYEGLRAKERQNEDANRYRYAKLNWDKEKAAVPKKETPKGFMDFYNPATGMTYRVAEKKWKANYSQIYNRIKEDLFKMYPALAFEEKFNKLKPSDREEYVKQYMYDNPTALNFLDNIAESKFKDGEPERQPEAPAVREDELQEMQKIVGNEKDEEKALRGIATYLLKQGYNRQQIEDIIRSVRK